MKSKLKCPFCETELEQGIELLRGGHILGCPKCLRNADDIFWFAMIKAKQDLDFFIEENDKSTTALAERSKELDKCQKDLEITTKALKEIRQKGLDVKATPFAIGFIADKALEQIKHKE